MPWELPQNMHTMPQSSSLREKRLNPEEDDIGVSLSKGSTQTCSYSDLCPNTSLGAVASMMPLPLAHLAGDITNFDGIGGSCFETSTNDGHSDSKYSISATFYTSILCRLGLMDDC
ncbi:uncharacterized protein N7506_005040 [Penicillium brevicompactum]|uniref:uncharacterized protein n=1 Tax=Penicillium brevicompactum TaxID=5074 RepID=UPI002541192D|nr:uncharacterized protein N7506_005040 [Penicillium brevicompactum]KAJ5337018.1 hypothetical protein N7506_005040 [Penicillium brevicompactum]